MFVAAAGAASSNVVALAPPPPALVIVRVSVSAPEPTVIVSPTMKSDELCTPDAFGVRTRATLTLVSPATEAAASVVLRIGYGLRSVALSRSTYRYRGSSAHSRGPICTKRPPQPP